jgi:hypothetical protein
MKGLSKLNTNQLRDLAVEMGANPKELYGTSKQALIIIIHQYARLIEEEEQYAARCEC